MDYLLWTRDNFGYILLGAVVLFFLIQGVLMFIRKRRKKQVPVQPPKFYTGTPTFSQYDMSSGLVQQKIYIEEQLREIEREGKMIVDENNILDGNYQAQKTNLNNRRQSSILKYNMWKKHLDEVNCMLGPNECRKVESDKFQKLGELR